MFLKKIEITGFKSFAKRTALDFSSAGVFNGGKNIGITAIVGPNGSGKSNVADALRWAMGEQSMKNLRGKKNQDVIFAGSGKKAQLGSAQVSIYLDNSQKKVPVDYEEIIITRKVFRDGESEYLINGSRVRLIDVIDLLAKAGIGQRSYCIINQGMADQILNANLFERRSIIEEAAGVKEYQIKKERSERKLKSTKANLERTEGLLKEIEPHLKILKRQSQKAQKGEEYRGILKQKQNELFGYLWKNFSDEENNLMEDGEDFGREIMVIQREIDEAREKLMGESKNSGNLQEKISILEEKQRSLDYSANNLERDILVEEGKIALEKERQKGLQIMETIPVGIDLIKEKLQEIRKNQNSLIVAINKARTVEDLKEIKKIAEPIFDKIRELSDGVEKGKIEKRKLDADLEKQRKYFEERIENMTKKVEDFRKEQEKIKENVKKVKEEIAKLIQQDKEERREAIKLEDLSRRKQFEMEKIKERHNGLKIELVKIQVRKEDLEKRIKQEMGTSPEKIDYRGVKADVEQTEREIFRLKSQLEQIGAIDSMVLEECKETQERYDFLSKESGDLKEAIVSLQKIVKEMDRKIKSRFEDTFENINNKFQEYFKIIFNGGKAGIEKIEVKARMKKEENVAEEDENKNNLPEEYDEEETRLGVEITAVPPGKKIASLGMLSGGERALTSLAFLFAIISFNPPPFAILDEVEAALDEANSKRFSRILQQLSGKTQFVLITHNRQTMREAAVLYGVTMNDDGASQLLSVKLDQVGEKGEINRG